MIWMVMRKSQRANRAVAEIRNSHMCINSSADINITSSPIWKRFTSDYHQKNHTQKQFLCFL